MVSIIHTCEYCKQRHARAASCVISGLTIIDSNKSIDAQWEKFLRPYTIAWSELDHAFNDAE